MGEVACCAESLPNRKCLTHKQLLYGRWMRTALLSGSGHVPCHTFPSQSKRDWEPKVKRSRCGQTSYQPYHNMQERRGCSQGTEPRTKGPSSQLVISECSQVGCWEFITWLGGDPTKYRPEKALDLPIADMVQRRCRT